LDRWKCDRRHSLHHPSLLKIDTGNPAWRPVIERKKNMHTPEWYGTIGILNSAHLKRRGLLDRLRALVAILQSTFAGCYRRRSARASGRRYHGSAQPRARGGSLRIGAQHA